MSIKRKLILIGICIGIVIIVFTVNVIRGMKGEPGEQPDDTGDTVIQADGITLAEAFRLLSYLEYNKSERESLPLEVIYENQSMSGWYDGYVNAVWKMGLIDREISVSPREVMTYGDCKSVMDKLLLKKPDYQGIYQGISFDFTKAEEPVKTREFLELYEAILAKSNEADSSQDGQGIEEATLLVLGNETRQDGSDRMVTNQGKYEYALAKSYEGAYFELEQRRQGITADSDQEASGEPVDISKYLDTGIKALVCDQELIFIKAITTEKIVLHNVWIKQGEGLQISAYIDGLDKTFEAQYKLSSSIGKVVGDITIENQKVVKILQKPETIQGKVLQTGEDFIEIEGYGKVPLEEEFKIYKLYGKLTQEPTSSILVGYENTDFVVSLGKISAALITESIKAENIRVLLMTSDYQGYSHGEIKLTASGDYTVSSENQEKTWSKGEILTLKPGDELLKDGRLSIKPVEEDGRVEVLSIDRSDGHPRYRGTIEIAEGDQGLLMVNELSLEEYLYAVIPSEMPTYYGLGPLRVQAVCARSYAYKQLLANSLSRYGAHVDDSVSYQVYNNIAENEDSVLAVKDTYGKVLEFNEEVITAYYFSTSSGHTAQASSVWYGSKDYPYLSGKLLYSGTGGEGAEDGGELEEKYTDLSSEDIFRQFLTDEELVTYDSGFNWYRWKVTMGAQEVAKVIDDKLSRRYTANPELILTQTGKDEDGNGVFESIPVDTVGSIVDISVRKRESSGIISELLIEGSKNTILVKTEYNIRTLLAPAYDTVIRQDESEVKKLSLLPSAFFFADQSKDGGKLDEITLTGGGYGHGVGMSQNGVKALADSGKDYEEILAYFYDGTQLGFIYE
ncbi:stage II sporulation protein D [Anaerotaenia torta]|uniref:SpoIID/LytB domain-containing protein n=1 Tax=Anaerotaenia torta TaxID=433293 RepID=UPI003D1B7979